MNHHLFNHLNFKQTFLPNGMNPDYEAECRRYDKILAENMPDLQLLGIGTNGHIAFNEPGTAFNLTTNVAELAGATVEANSHYFKTPADVPTHAFSMGIKSIMQAQKILLIASGANKAQAIKEMIEASVTNESPVSILQTHPDVTVIIDEEAATLLSSAE